MNVLWKRIKRWDATKEKKNGLYLSARTLLHALIGALIWFLIGQWFLEHPVWVICFIGYPAVLSGLFGGILYLYQHEF